MGIKDFTKNIKQEYPKAFKSQWLSSYDYIYIDLNYALHNCSYEIKSKQDVYLRLFKYIENILLDTNPRKKIYFTSDGSAPLAKLLLQRSRRKNKSSISEEANEKISALFTPGTDFMINLKSEMEVFMKYLSYVFNVDVEFLEKDSDEAELKLKLKIMENISDDKSCKLTHLFVSNDADVVLMLTTLENYTNVFVYDKKDSITMSVYKLMDLHTNKVGLTQNSGLDFTALNLFLGNDYLPKVDYIDYHKLWEAYSKISLNNSVGLVIKNGNDIKINTSFYIKLMAELIVNMKKCYLTKPKPNELMSTMYINYYDGFAWCMTTYVNGICSRYNYMYGYDTKPHPLGLMFNLEHLNNEFIKNQHMRSDPLPSKLYLILLLPKSQKHLIDKKYHQFMEQEKGLYVEEYCEKCKYFNTRLNELNDNSEEFNRTKKTLSLHKKQHPSLALHDIDDIYARFTKINKN